MADKPQALGTPGGRLTAAPEYVGMMDAPRRRCPVCDGGLRAAGSKRDPLSRAPYRYSRCTRCGFLFVNPRPSLAGLAEFYRSGVWAIVGGNVDRREEDVDPVRFIPWALSHLRSPGRTMLDVGAGTGCYTRAGLAMGLRVTALEPDKGAADALRRSFAIPVYNCGFEDFEPPRRFDLVLSNQVMGHVHDPVLWASKFAEATAPGGVVVLGVLHGGGFWQRWIGLRDPYAKPPLHLNHFTAPSLRRLLERQGLEVCAMRTYSRFPWALLSRKARVPGPLRPAVDAVFRHAQRPPLAVLDRLGLGIFLEIVARKPMTSP